MSIDVIVRLLENDRRISIRVQELVYWMFHHCLHIFFLFLNPKPIMIFSSWKKKWQFVIAVIIRIHGTVK